MWRLRRFIPPHQEVHHDANDDNQNGTDDDETMRHTVLSSPRCYTTGNRSARKTVLKGALRSLIHDAVNWRRK